ncbi:hypothetical protein HYW72_00065 [Candidatus Nomurabacteria bacterium]|nr:hypothetical protein [Candidatus Nomurabacteria bacterium]
MVTPELIEYIKGELAKGKTREKISAELASGGWNEADLSEAFRTVIPMQSFVAPNATAQNTVTSSVVKNKAKSPKRILENLIFIIVALICLVSWYFYRPQIINFWNSGVDKIAEFSGSLFGSKPSVEISIGEDNNGFIPNAVNMKDCGGTVAPDIKNPSTYNNNSVLTCLGNSALRCENAKAVLKDDLFPDIFQIIKNQKTCNFKLSFGEDNALIDATGKKLAFQYITCPIDIVKALDESNPKSPIFKLPNKNDLGKYASQIYFYGTLGVFMENNLDKNKIQNLGCSGSYIDSVIASYRKMELER